VVEAALLTDTDGNPVATELAEEAVVAGDTVLAEDAGV
jgi:hypothetical protein